MSDSLQPQGQHHVRLPCPSPSPRQSLLKLMSIESVMPSNHLILCHPFSSCLLSFPASGSFPVNQLFPSGGQRTGTSASASVLPMNIQGWFPLGLTSLISLLSKGLSKVFSNTNSSKASILQHSAFFMVQFSRPYMTTGKTMASTMWLFAGKVISLLFNTLFRFVIAFLPRSKHLLISWLQSPYAVILEPKKIKSVSVSTVSPSICLEVMGSDAMIFIFWMLSFKPAFSLPNLLYHYKEINCQVLDLTRSTCSKIKDTEWCKMVCVSGGGVMFSYKARLSGYESHFTFIRCDTKQCAWFLCPGFLTNKMNIKIVSNSQGHQRMTKNNVLKAHRTVPDTQQTVNVRFCFNSAVIFLLLLVALVKFFWPPCLLPLQGDNNG